MYSEEKNQDKVMYTLTHYIICADWCLLFVGQGAVNWYRVVAEELKLLKVQNIVIITACNCSEGWKPSFRLEGIGLKAYNDCLMYQVYVSLMNISIRQNIKMMEHYDEKQTH